MGWRARLVPLGATVAFAAGLAAVSRLFLVVSVAGGSMAPALLPADIAIVRKASAVERGQIALLASHSGSLVLHRIVRRLPDGSVTTKGDANAVPDLEPTPQARVLGPVVAVVPAGTVLERWRRTGAYATLTAQQNSARR